MRKQSVPGPLPSSWEGPGNEAMVIPTFQNTCTTKSLRMRAWQLKAAVHNYCTRWYIDVQYSIQWVFNVLPGTCVHSFIG